jgi:hypothetical protein
MNLDDAEDVRRLRREFVLAHHPDHGGDPVVFIDGLARLTAELRIAQAPPRIVVVRRLPWHRRLTVLPRRLLTRRRKVPRVY